MEVKNRKKIQAANTILLDNITKLYKINLTISLIIFLTTLTCLSSAFTASSASDGFSYVIKPNPRDFPVCCSLFNKTGNVKVRNHNSFENYPE